MSFGIIRLFVWATQTQAKHTPQLVKGRVYRLDLKVLKCRSTLKRAMLGATLRDMILCTNLNTYC